MASYKIFIRRADEGAYFVKNGRGQVLDTEGCWTFDAKKMRVFDCLNDAWLDAELCHTFQCLGIRPKIFVGKVFVRFHSPDKRCRAKDVGHYLREALEVNLDLQNCGNGPSFQKCLCSVEVDFGSFVEREQSDQLELNFP